MIKKLFFLLILIVVALVLGRNFLIKNGAATFVNVKSGMSLKMNRFDLGLLSSKLNIENLELFNSSRFKKERMVSIPKILVDISLLKLASGQCYFKSLELDVDEFAIIRNKQGELNLKDFQAFKSKKKEESREKKARGDSSFFIEDFQLKIGSVIYKDYMAGETPEVKVFKIGLNKKLSNVESVQTLISLVLFEALTKTTIPSLLNMDLKDLSNLTEGTLNKATEATQKAINSGTAATEKAIDTSSKKMQELEEKAKKSLDKFQKELDKLAPTTAE